jgi:hypothetical protein
MPVEAGVQFAVVDGLAGSGELIVDSLTIIRSLISLQ